MAADTVTVDVSSSSETQPEVLVLTENGANTSQFTGSIATGPAPAVAGDGIIQVAHGDLLPATYHDSDDGRGVPAISFETADVDCGGPTITGVQVTDIRDDGAMSLDDVGLSSSASIGTDPALRTPSPTARSSRPVRRDARLRMRTRTSG
jgi:hypothetical protein